MFWHILLAFLCRYQVAQIPHSHAIEPVISPPQLGASFPSSSLTPELSTWSQIDTTQTQQQRSTQSAAPSASSSLSVRYSPPTPDWRATPSPPRKAGGCACAAHRVRTNRGRPSKEPIHSRREDDERRGLGTYESADGHAGRDRWYGARADVARQPAAGGEEGEQEGLRCGVVLR